MTPHRQVYIYLLLVSLILGFLSPIHVYPVQGSDALYYQSGDSAEFLDANTGQKNTYIAAPQGVGIDILSINQKGSLSLVTRVVSQGQPFSAAYVMDNNTRVLVVAAGQYLESYSLEDPRHPVRTRVIELPGYYFYHVSRVASAPDQVVVSSTRGVEVRLVHDFSLLATISREPSWASSWGTYNNIAVVTQTKALRAQGNGVNTTWRDMSKTTFMTVPYATSQFGYYPVSNGIIRMNEEGVIKTYTPRTHQGYAVTGSPDTNFVYLVNGWGVITLNKDLGYVRSRALSGSGMWAAGIQRVSVGGTPYLVVFNGKGIRTLDESLNIRSTWVAPEVTFVKERTMSSVSLASGVQITGTGLYPGDDAIVRVDGVTQGQGVVSDIGTLSLFLPGVKGKLIEVTCPRTKFSYQTTFR